MNEKFIYKILVKLKFNNGVVDNVIFYSEADNHKQAENKVRQWLLEGKSGYLFSEILFIELIHNVQVIY